MQVSIEKIKVSDRIRKDFGDIEELANDIKENGLINPPVVTPEYELIAGERRLRAMKSLGYNQIEVRIMTVQDALHQLKLEISENENRKDFTFSEKMKWAEQLKVEYEKIARENQGTRTDLTSGTIVPLVRVRDKIAEDIGFNSGRNFERAEYIYKNASDEDIKALDEKETSINAVYQELKKKEKEVEQKEKEIQELQNELETRPVVEKVKEVEVERVVEKIVDKDGGDDSSLKYDLEKLKQEKERIEKLNRALENSNSALKNSEAALISRAESYKSDAEKYREFVKQQKYIQTNKDDFSRTIGSITSIATLVSDIESMIQTKLAPVKYSRAVQEQIHNETVINNILEMVGRVSGWCNEMYSLVKDEKSNSRDYYVVDDYTTNDNINVSQGMEIIEIKGEDE